MLAAPAPRDPPLALSFSPVLTARYGWVEAGVVGGVAGSLRYNSHLSGYVGGMAGVTLPAWTSARLETDTSDGRVWEGAERALREPATHRLSR